MGSRVWLGIGTLATRGMQTQLLQELRNKEQSTNVRPWLILAFVWCQLNAAFDGAQSFNTQRKLETFPCVRLLNRNVTELYYRDSAAVAFMCCVREWHLPAVQMVKTTCTESKKKNMTSRDTEAPMGRNRACVESIVWIPARQQKRHTFR